MSFSERIRKDRDIIDAVKKDYHDASTWLPFSAVEINNEFSDEEVKEIAEFLNEVGDAAGSNEKQAKAVEKYSKIAFKLLKLAKVAI